MLFFLWSLFFIAHKDNCKLKSSLLYLRTEILQSSQLIAGFFDKACITFKSDYHITVLTVKLLLVSLTHPSLSTRNCTFIKYTGSAATDFDEIIKFRYDLRVQKIHYLKCVQHIGIEDNFRKWTERIFSLFSFKAKHLLCSKLSAHLNTGFKNDFQTIKYIS